MNTLFSTIGISAADIELFTETYNKISADFNSEFNETPAIDLQGFECFKNYTSTKIQTSIQITKSNRTFFVVFILVNYTLPAASKYSGDYNGTEFQAWGFTVLNNHFGHVIIQHETFTERLLELIQHIEFNFEDDIEFNKKFYVLASDKIKATLAMNTTFQK